MRFFPIKKDKIIWIGIVLSIQQITCKTQDDYFEFSKLPCFGIVESRSLEKRNQTSAGLFLWKVVNYVHGISILHIHTAEGQK